MDSSSVVLGMILAIVIFFLGFILGTEYARMAVRREKPITAKPVDEKDEDDEEFYEDADWWRKGRNPNDD